MEASPLQINDLPDEILMIIFKNMYNTELLYSLLDVDKRLNRIVCDSAFTYRLNLLRLVPSRLIVLTSLSRYFIYPLLDPILNRFCLQILPQICDKIKWLNLESSSIKRILRSANYPALYGFGLYNIEAKEAINLFFDETLFSWTLKNQISALVIDISTNGQRTSTEDVNVLLFIHILTVFPNLRYLNFGPSSIWYQQLSYDTQLSTMISSSLLELHVCLPDLIDCIYLLDGCFNQLRTLHVNITYTMSSNSTINNKEKLPNLRFFSLRSNWDTDCYDELIVPLLNRMLNLEELNLFLQVTGRQKFVDSKDLKKNIIDHMPRLNKFKFSICSTIQLDTELDFPSNENIQKTFRNFKDNQIISYVDYFPKARQGQCHIYSYPYKLKNYDKITNNFPGGLFKFVRDVSLYDERPFEHEFFLRISRSFPYMEKLTLVNRKQQNNKQCRKSKNQNFSIITYPHLIELDLHKTHKDYHRQFLFDITTCLPDNVRVCVDYRLMKKVTHNFRRNITRNNCSKISYVFFYYKSEFPEHLKDYFPRARIP
ncbi:unnamed protein product [Rotaria sp. Silwood1]|nr:unnamed protein product [Rotaria sp. Silwood1]CAF3396084.1 unnamed protein product [Rotaria sp. Silwood1]CAF4646278.1 unnamed protein product [Rotaria sp. Silwood1]CAF4938754.1 unnamed protein product [Rotaria sp. Silwood1]